MGQYLRPLPHKKQSSHSIAHLTGNPAPALSFNLQPFTNATPEPRRIPPLNAKTAASRKKRPFHSYNNIAVRLLPAVVVAFIATAATATIATFVIVFWPGLVNIQLSAVY